MVGPGGEPPKRAHLYVGNLSPRVTEYMLQEIFAVAGPVLGVKIIPDRSMQHGGINYGFVEYHEMRSAETALQALNGRRIFDLEVRVNWAYQNTNTQKEDLSQHYHLFVGDLSPEVNDSVLQKAFSAFGSLSDARVMWDANTGKSRGYGFLAFRDRTDAEQAINAMNGEWLGARAIRVNWANQKNNQGVPQPGGGPGMSSSGGPPPTSVSGLSVEGSLDRKVDPRGWQLDAVINQAPAHNTTVYVGNLVPYATQADLAPLFQSIGHVFEIRLQADRGFAFVKYATHELAASAIVNLNGTMVHGRPLKLSWGKESGRNDGPQGGYAPQPVAAGAAPPQDPAAAAAAMAAWQAQYGAQWAACKSGSSPDSFESERQADSEIMVEQTFNSNRRCSKSRASVRRGPGSNSSLSSNNRLESRHSFPRITVPSMFLSNLPLFFFLPIRLARPLRPTSQHVSLLLTLFGLTSCSSPSSGFPIKFSSEHYVAAFDPTLYLSSTVFFLSFFF